MLLIIFSSCPSNHLIMPSYCAEDFLWYAKVYCSQSSPSCCAMIWFGQFYYGIPDVYLVSWQFSTLHSVFRGPIFSFLVWLNWVCCLFAFGWLGTHTQIYIWQIMDKYNYNFTSLFVTKVNPRAPFSRESIGAAGLW